MGVHATASAIDQIDQGKFERLAIAVLRHLYPALVEASEVGINSEGKAIKGPWDAIYVEAGPPRTFHAVFHTTTQRDGLMAKWLSKDPTRLGDVIGVASFIADKRLLDADTRLTVYLTSNRVLEKTAIEHAQAYCEDRRIVVHFVGQDRISEYLDQSPDGQYLRKRYFEIGQERLSSDLLREICSDSLAEHAKRFSLSPQTYVRRTQDDELGDAASHPATRALVLEGSSGFGKSAILHSCMKAQLAEGGFAIWLPQENAEAEPFLVSALTKTLKQIVPTLDERAGSDALRLAALSHLPLLVGVDDINLSSNPSALLDKVSGWGSLGASEKNSDRMVLVVVPVWPLLWKAFSDGRDQSKRPRFISVGELSVTEGTALVAQHLMNSSLDAPACAEIAELTGYDPFLISLLPRSHVALVEARNGDLLARYVKNVVAKMQLRGNFLSRDYRAALRTAAEYVALKRALSPRLDSLNSFFQKKNIDTRILNELLQDRRAIYVDEATESLVFRHDRLRDWFLIDVFRTALDGMDPIVFDPFWSQQVGSTIAAFGVKDDVALEFARRNPIALAFAYQQARADELNPVVFSALRDAIVNPSEEIPLSAFREIAFVSAKADRADFLELTDGADASQYFLGRFAQGDANSAVYFSTHFLADWENYSETADWIRRAERHQSLRSGILGLLSCGTNSDKAKALLLRLAARLHSYLPIEAVFQAYLEVNDRSSARPGVVSCLLADGKSEREIIAIIDELLELPDMVETSSGLVNNPRYHEIEAISRFSGDISPESAATLLKVSGLGGDHFQVVRGLLENNENIVALRLWLSLVATVQQYQSLAWSLYAQRWDESFAGSRMPVETAMILYRLWNDRSLDVNERQGALRIWSRVAKRTALPALRAITSETFERSKSLEDEGLRQRLRLGDTEAVSQFQEKLEGPEADFWIREASFVWNETVEYACRKHFDRSVVNNGSLDGNIAYFLGTLLQKIPLESAQSLLRSYGDHLDRELFVAAALYCGDGALTDKAHRLIDEAENKQEILSKAWRYFGYKTHGLSDKLTFDLIRRFEPYLAEMSEYALSSIAEYLTNDAQLSWRREYVDPLLTPGCLARFEPTSDDHFRELDEAEPRQFFPFYWIERFATRGEPLGDAIKIVRRWSEARKTSRSRSLYIDAVVNYGDRSDLTDLKFDAAWLDLSESAKSQVEFMIFRRSLS